MNTGAAHVSVHDAGNINDFFHIRVGVVEIGKILVPHGIIKSDFRSVGNEF
ncbi:hypothetical protein SDC9_70748 [bioreactor metagenome]|uniref:Uncharacterized protein n=1 Tax=bioreactor metagenome TaxID=1076179 RepID=A0A644Y7X0_9ZZZZ